MYHKQMLTLVFKMTITANTLFIELCNHLPLSDYTIMTLWQQT